MEPVTVTFTGRLEAFLEPLAAGQDGGRAAWQEAVALPTAASRWDRLLCEEALPLQLLPHQRRAVLQVLGPLEGRAILADEVGLGKTVEALLVARELMERGLAQTLLALVPAGLVGQWLWEAQRVGVPLERPGGTRSWSRAPRLITTLERARRPEVRELLTQRSWDVVVVDEAHRLQNPATLSFRLVNGLQKKYLLLLTATPMQNELRELYHLVTLLRPGHFHTLASFRRYFMLDRREPRNLPLLRERLREVMVRTTRREAALELPPRRVRVERLAPNEAEAHLLAQALAAAREAAAALPQGKGRLALVTLLKQAASSPASLAQSLERLSRRGGMLGRERAARLLAWCRQVPVSTKLEAAVRLLQEPEPALVFTEFRGTQVALAQRLRQEGWEPLLLHGGMGSREREAVLRAFARGEGRVLVATDAGSVGHNLQFCRRVINVDLPWNPMRLEQRIGRVHRYGQLRPVEVVHLVLQGSLEESILRLLMEKLNLFERVVGELELILGDAGLNVEAELAQVLAGPEPPEAVLARVGERITQAARRYEAARRRLGWLDLAEGGRP
ncbi:MAG: SNF2-related protein [Limnochorda sp.]|uniref:DEAD/DEAH box helicase n=1 Tax=Limnochorda TaxID=1676651 RepID=UPI001ECC8736|nr:SNF2-related protein [Limnochorda pilosa]MBO2518788.1 ATP-dependent helicase [Bacillota bacterium]